MQRCKSATQFSSPERTGKEVDETLRADGMEVDRDRVQVGSDCLQWHEGGRDVPAISVYVFNCPGTFTVGLIGNRH